MNSRLLAFLVWIAFCVITIAAFTPLLALVVITLASVLALALRWVCRAFLQVTPAAAASKSLESIRPENL